MTAAGTYGGIGASWLAGDLFDDYWLDPRLKNFKVSEKQLFYAKAYLKVDLMTVRELGVSHITYPPGSEELQVSVDDIRAYAVQNPEDPLSEVINEVFH